MLDMPRVREVFEASTDFTVGIEEEFAILDPETLSLDQRFEELREAAQDDPVLAESVAGELIQSEIEIRSGRGENFADAVARQREARARLFAPRRRAATRCSAPPAPIPWSPWQEQQIIDTDHYRRVQERPPVRGVAQQHLQRARARRRARRRAGGARCATGCAR